MRPFAVRCASRCSTPRRGRRLPVSRQPTRHPSLRATFLDAVAHWGDVDTLNVLAGRTVALRFTMDDATVYGFHFQPAPEPSTIVLLGTGLAGLLAYAWKKRKRRVDTAV